MEKEGWRVAIEYEVSDWNVGTHGRLSQFVLSKRNGQDVNVNCGVRLGVMCRNGKNGRRREEEGRGEREEKEKKGKKET